MLFLLLWAVPVCWGSLNDDSLLLSENIVKQEHELSKHVMRAIHWFNTRQWYVIMPFTITKRPPTRFCINISSKHACVGASACDKHVVVNITSRWWICKTNTMLTLKLLEKMVFWSTSCSNWPSSDTLKEIFHEDFQERHSLGANTSGFAGGPSFCGGPLDLKGLLRSLTRSNLRCLDSVLRANSSHDSIPPNQRRLIKETETCTNKNSAFWTALRDGVHVHFWRLAVCE